MAPPPPGTRPRVEGDREQEILEATLEVLADLGYDRLTMDAVAGRAKASKATLYRRWNNKAQLVIDSLCSRKDWDEAPEDTGSFRGDLLATFCGVGGMTDSHSLAILGAVVTAIGRDSEFAEAFRRDFVGPKEQMSRLIYERAQARGEIADDAELELLIPALPGIILHRALFLGDPPTEDLIERVVDHVIIPAATHGRPTPPHPQGNEK